MSGWRALAAMVLAASCSGCATGRSPSMAAAPLTFTTNQAGDLEVARADRAPAAGPSFRLVGDFSGGVRGFDAVAGNALLSTSQAFVALLTGGPPNLPTSPSPEQTAAVRAGLSVGPGLASVDASLALGAGTAGGAFGVQAAELVGIQANAVLAPSGSDLAAAVTGPVGVSAALAPPAPSAQGPDAVVSVSVDAAAPSAVAEALTPTVAAVAAPVAPIAEPVAAVATPAAEPVIAAVGQALTTQGPVLEASVQVAPPAATAALAGGPVTSVLDALRRRGQ